MSLKALHIVFITFATMLAIWFAVWGLQQYAAGGSTVYLVTGIAAILAGAGLVVYGVWFLRKLKHVSFM